LQLKDKDDGNHKEGGKARSRQRTLSNAAIESNAPIEFQQKMVQVILSNNGFGSGHNVLKEPPS
jgi:hypothetical protein